MKVYNGEKAIISLTSWKARINTVSKTIFSLLKMCPGFHIVLVLSEEEFPKKEKELPNDLMMFVNANLIEILWVYKNTKSFKKFMYTLSKYNNVPVISADDDCVYINNYAELLYKKWTTNKNCVISAKVNKHYGVSFQYGPATLYPPIINNLHLIDKIKDSYFVNAEPHDDVFIGVHLKKNNIKILSLDLENIIIFHDEIDASKNKRQAQHKIKEYIKIYEK